MTKTNPFASRKESDRIQFTRHISREAVRRSRIFQELDRDYFKGGLTHDANSTVDSGSCDHATALSFVRGF
jgi:hypothetical protein